MTGRDCDEVAIDHGFARQNKKKSLIILIMTGVVPEYK